jgi:hypothetical protein
MLDEGVVATVEELAQREPLEGDYMSRALRLMLLAPEIVEAILGGGDVIKTPSDPRVYLVENETKRRGPRRSHFLVKMDLGYGEGRPRGGGERHPRWAGYSLGWLSTGTAVQLVSSTRRRSATPSRARSRRCPSSCAGR